MRGPIAHCRQCGTLFEAPSFIGGPGVMTNTTFSGIRISCPKGHVADVLDGTFDFYENATRLVSGSELTRELFEKATKVIVESPADITAAELSKQVGAINKTLGELVTKVSGGEGRKHGLKWKTTLVVVLAAIAATKCSINLDVNKLIDQLQRSAPTHSQSADPQQQQHEPDKNGGGARTP